LVLFGVVRGDDLGDGVEREVFGAREVDAALAALQFFARAVEPGLQLGEDVEGHEVEADVVLLVGEGDVPVVAGGEGQELRPDLFGVALLAHALADDVPDALDFAAAVFGQALQVLLVRDSLFGHRGLLRVKGTRPASVVRVESTTDAGRVSEGRKSYRPLFIVGFTGRPRSSPRALPRRWPSRRSRPTTPARRRRPGRPRCCSTGP
jgi:hypothetical protein